MLIQEQVVQKVKEHPKEYEAAKKLIQIDESKKCFMCKKKFPDGVINRHPSQIVNWRKWIKGEFLFHLQSTHGIAPEMFWGMLTGELK